MSDGIHTVLDVAGLVPGFGEIADGINAGFYLAQGDTTNAALSGAAMIPFAGWAATTTKLGLKATKGLAAVNRVEHLLAHNPAEIMGTLRDIARTPGPFGLDDVSPRLGKLSMDEVDTLGKMWVGDGYRVAGDGRTLVSSDGLKQFRPPTKKAHSGEVQANLEWRSEASGPWNGNAHVDISE
ncbi:MAG: hypothetical protein EPO26_11590 [Chloroflexota bacterium]|nr:MAG: hypothetical protein EPO26_11590 [Chloroflexota bacterium]